MAVVINLGFKFQNAPVTPRNFPWVLSLPHGHKCRRAQSKADATLDIKFLCVFTCTQWKLARERKVV